MNTKRNLASFLFLCAAYAGVLHEVNAQQVWIGPQSKSNDLAIMFNVGGGFESNPLKINVLKLYGNPFIVPSPQRDIDRLVANLNRLGIAIAVEAGVINVATNSRPSCGGWGLVEGYGPVKMHDLIAKKILAAGGRIKYIAMDEPLWYGHYFRGRLGAQPGCQSAIGILMQSIEPSIKTYVNAFPDVLIGDVEPSSIVRFGPDPVTGKDWRETLREWAGAFRNIIGRQLDFVQVDIAWAEPHGVENAKALFLELRNLQKQGLIGHVGVIYNGNASDTSDEQWVQSARRHMDIVHGQLRLSPDQVVIQSWDAYPTHNEPDGSTNTLSSVVRHFREYEK